MLVIPNPPQAHNSNQRADCAPAPAKLFFVCSDLAADETEYGGYYETQKQRQEHDWFHNEEYVPRVPMPVERHERAHAVVVGEVQQNMAECGDNPKKEQQSPTRREWRSWAWAY